MSEPGLQAMQGWMKTVLVTRGNLKQKLEEAETLFQLNIADIVESKRGVSAERRLDIYAAGYVLRLLECMKCDYPGLLAFMGEELFGIFARAYIVSLPSQSWSLYHLSERFPEFLRATAPKHPAGNEQQQSLAELPSEIAAFERAKAELMNARGTEDDPLFNNPAFLDPAGLLLNEKQVHTSPCLRLLQQKFPLNEFLNQLQHNPHVIPPERKTTYVALTRHQYRIRIAELEHWQYSFLKNCSTTSSLLSCAQKAAEESGTDTQKILAALLLWLPMMVDMGMVRMV